MPTLLELKTRVLDLADHTNGSRVTDARLTEYINASGRLVNALIQSANEHHKFSEKNFTMDGSESYDLPDDFEHAYAVFWVSNGKKHRMDRATIEDFHRYNMNNDPDDFPWFGNKYIIIGQKLFVLPVPKSGRQVTMWYQNKYTAITNDNDPFPTWWPDLAQDFIVYSVVARVYGRDRKQNQFWKAEANELRFELMQQLEDRDRNEPHKIKNTQYNEYPDYWFDR